MDRQYLISEINRIAMLNGGVPPGSGRFRNRFAQKRKNGEWYELAAGDFAVFQTTEIYVIARFRPTGDRE